MKKAILFAMAILLSAPLLHAGESIPMDWSLSKVTWVGKKVLGQHNGTVKIKDLELSVVAKELNVVPIIDAERPARVVIDMNNIAAEDLKDADANAKLVGHLKSEDFFDVAKFPTATLVLTEAKPKDASTQELKGKLTIKGVTRDVSFPAKVSKSGDTWKAVGTLTVDRTQYDIRYRSGKFFEGLGDKIIKDEFEIGFEIVIAPKKS